MINNVLSMIFISLKMWLIENETGSYQDITQTFLKLKKFLFEMPYQLQ